MKLNYDEISPITGNKSVMVEYDEDKGQNMKLCMESGYQTFDSWKDGSEIVDKFLSVSPELIRNTALVDDNENVWVKIIMMTPDIVLAPDIRQTEDQDDFIWKVSTFKLLEKGQLPEADMVAVKVGDLYKALDEDTASIFEELDFENATIEFYNRVNSN